MMKTSLMNMRKRIDCWREVSKQRRELREHASTICKDIGVSRATLDFETKRLSGKEVIEDPESSHRRRIGWAVILCQGVQLLLVLF